MYKYIKPAMSLALALMLLLSVGFAHADNDEAERRAAVASIPDGLTAHEAEIYRRGFVAGYTEALNPTDMENEYILNTSSKRFHYPSCQSAASIAPQNRDAIHATRDEVISMEYRPCGICKP